jgi:hypothetical protein
MSQAQSKILAENKFDIETELDNADTELNLLKIKHNKLQKSITDASGYQNNLNSDLKDIVESKNTAINENKKLKIEQDKLYEIQLNKLNDFDDLLAQIAQLQVTEGSESLDIYPPRFDKAQADINVTLKTLSHCSDNYRTSLDYMNRKDWQKHVNYLVTLTNDADNLMKANSNLQNKWNESAGKLNELKLNQIDRNRCRNVNEYFKNYNKLVGDRLNECNHENSENKPKIYNLKEDLRSAESNKLDPRELERLNQRRLSDMNEINDLNKMTTLLNQKLSELSN